MFYPQGSSLYPQGISYPPQGNLYPQAHLQAGFHPQANFGANLLNPQGIYGQQGAFGQQGLVLASRGAWPARLPRPSAACGAASSGASTGRAANAGLAGGERVQRHIEPQRHLQRRNAVIGCLAATAAGAPSAAATRSVSLFDRATADAAGSAGCSKRGRCLRRPIHTWHVGPGLGREFRARHDALERCRSAHNRGRS